MMLFSDLLDLDYGKERILVKDLTPICKKWGFLVFWYEMFWQDFYWLPLDLSSIQ